MTDKPRWEPTPEEWRALTITFVGGVASIVVGAGILGAALALARWQTRNGGAVGVITLAVGGLLCWLSLPSLWKESRGRESRLSPWLVIVALAAVFDLLVLIGVGVGVK